MGKNVFICLGVVVLTFLLSGCGLSEHPKTADEVKVQLKWVHQAQFAGFYLAKEKGYYARENIAVTFMEGGQGIDSAGSVISGKADFGVMAPEDILIKRSQGEALVAISAIYRRSAVVYAAMADSGIIRPSDFLGKKIAVGGIGGALRDFEFQLYVMMNKLKLNIQKMNIVAYDPDYAAFCERGADVTAAYSTGGLIRMRQKELKLNLIWPGD